MSNTQSASLVGDGVLISEGFVQEIFCDWPMQVLDLYRSS
jgi:hypothetical protein